jgi:hypothetical protein
MSRAAHGKLFVESKLVFIARNRLTAKPAIPIVHVAPTSGTMSTMAQTLMAPSQEQGKSCPRTSGSSDNNLAPLDLQTPTVFENNYYKNLCKKGLLHSDQELLNSGSTYAQVQSYISSQSTFLLILWRAWSRWVTSHRWRAPMGKPWRTPEGLTN